MSTLTEENYLKSIFHLSKADALVSTNDIAKRMETSAASVTDMVKRLSTKKLVNYKPYKGVKLTGEGGRIASAIVRKHRLWECFLVDKLDYSWDEVHELAEQLEHVESDDLTARLEAFLGFPEFDPHGDPIPDAKGRFKKTTKELLADAKTGRTYVVAGVKDSSVEFLQYLDSIGLVLGVRVKLKDRIEFDGTNIVEIEKGKQLMISEKGSLNIYLKPISKS
jgi:DtxR family Mn-dependent transcriptional regulator